MREVINAEQNDVVRISSREVAEMMDTRHDSVIRKIDNISQDLIDHKSVVNSLWVENTYVASNGKSNKEYLVSKEGCEFLAHKSTGTKGNVFTLKYMQRFKEMEEQLKNLTPQISEKEQMLLKLFSSDPVEVATAHKRIVEIEVEEATTPLLDTIEEQKPKADTYDKFIEKEHTLGFREMRKEIESASGLTIKENVFKDILRDLKIIGKTVKASAYAIRNNYATTKDIEDKFGSTRTQDRFTMKCRELILDYIDNEFIKQ